MGRLGLLQRRVIWIIERRHKTEEAARYPSVSTESVMTLMRSKQKHSYERNAHFLDFVMILNTFNCQS